MKLFCKHIDWNMKLYYKMSIIGVILIAFYYSLYVLSNKKKVELKNEISSRKIFIRYFGGIDKVPNYDILILLEEKSEYVKYIFEPNFFNMDSKHLNFKDSLIISNSFVLKSDLLNKSYRFEKIYWDNNSNGLKRDILILDNKRIENTSIIGEPNNMIDLCYKLDNVLYEIYRCK